MPRILLAAMEAPAPLPQMSMPASTKPRSTAWPDRPRVVRVIDGIRGERAEVEEFVAARLESRRYLFLERKAGVVAADGDSHGSGAYSLRISADLTTLPYSRAWRMRALA